MRSTPALCAAVVFLLIAGSAQADRRSFAFTYEPRTIPEGELELEYYMTGQVKHNRLLDENIYGWSHQFEVEYGVFDGFDLAMYQMYSPSSWQGYKLRARYMPLARGELPVDFLLYFEFIQLANGDVALEERLILGREFGKLIIALDTMFEQGPLTGDVGHKLNSSLGTGWAFTKWFTAGVETQLRMQWEPEFNYASGEEELEFSGTRMYTGPSLSFATGRLFWDASFGTRIQGDEDEARHIFRVLWGIML